MKATFSQKAWLEWLQRLQSERATYCPVIIEEQVHWTQLKSADLSGQGPVMAFRRVRAAEPVKSFFFQPADRVASFPETSSPPQPEPRVVIGLKSCDLTALKVHDVMFSEGQYADPFYIARRRNTVLIAADCPQPEESCFCNLVGGKPYVENGADITMAQIDGQYLLEACSPQGEELLVSTGQFWQPASEAAVAKRDEERRAAVARLEELNSSRLRPDLAKALTRRSSDHRFWTEQGEDCVECSGCLIACPTCYCFLLCDSRRGEGGGMVRTRTWDACYLAAYQRVGGGANPRAEFVKRFVNRFRCKFEHFQNAHGFYACTGCGRCYKTCMGKIDIRKVLTAL